MQLTVRCLRHVDLQGRFVAEAGPLAGKYVKNSYYAEGEEPKLSVDEEIAITDKPCYCKGHQVAAGRMLRC